MSLVDAVKQKITVTAAFTDVTGQSFSEGKGRMPENNVDCVRGILEVC
jgi:hypothetical protein